jgi:hypothetical protein
MIGRKERESMGTVIRTTIPLPVWTRKCIEKILSLTWYEYLGWVVELVLVGTFATVSLTQFLEDEPRAGWIMISLSSLVCGPGLWLLLGYRPKPGDKFGGKDIAAALIFCMWIFLFAFLVGWEVQFEPGPFGSPGA